MSCKLIALGLLAAGELAMAVDTTCEHVHQAYVSNECCNADRAKLVSDQALALIPGCKNETDWRDTVWPAPAVTITADSQNCDGSQCFNRLHPSIPMVAYANPGDIVLFDTPTGTADIKNKSLYEENLAFIPSVQYIATLHQLAGPLGINGAVAGDKIAVKILDIEAEDWGWNHAAPGLGFLSDMVKSQYFTWWKPKGSNLRRPDVWTSDRLPGVEVPYNPFPGIVTTLPSAEVVQRVKAREAQVLADGGAANLAGSLRMGVTGDIPSAFPSAICGLSGSDPDNCLRTISPDVYYGNEDSQRITVGNTLILECFVDGCGIGIGDVHGAQGDGEVSITAIEIEAHVKIEVQLIKPGDPMYHLPSPTTLGKTNNPLASSPFVSFHGFSNKPDPIPAFAEEVDFPWPIQQHATFADAVLNKTFVADNLQLGARNALLKCLTWLHEVLGYSFNQGLVLASVAVDLRVAQVVDKPQGSVEAYLPLNIFTGEAKAKVEAAVGFTF